MNRLWLVALVMAVVSIPLAAETISMSVTDVKMETITDPVTATLLIQSDPASDLIYRLRVEPPHLLARGREPGNAEFFVDYDDARVGGVPVEILPARASSRWSLETLFFRENNAITFPLFIQYAVRDEPPEPWQKVNVTVTPRGPLAGVILAAILGIAAVLVFRLAYRLATKGGKSIGRAYLRRARDSFLLGVVVVVLAIVIVRLGALKFENLPITIDVRNAAGGFMIGLFFEPLARYLAEKLGSTSPAVATPAQT